MNEEKKKRRQEERRIREINNSLKYLSNPAQKTYGILAVQEQENVFFCGDKMYKKVYTVQPSILKNKKCEMVKALCELFGNRIRLTQFMKNHGDRLSSYMFMTVSFEAGSYYEAQKQIREFEEKLRTEITSILHVDIQECALDSVISYMYLNYSGKMKQLDTGQFYAAKAHHDIGKLCKEEEKGRFSCDNSYGIAFIGKNYPNEIQEMEHLFSEKNVSYQVCVDFQSYDSEDKEVFQLQLKRRYCNEKSELDDIDIVNMSYFFIVIVDSKEQLLAMEEYIYKYFDKMRVLIMPAVGRAREIYLSMCTIGMRDFHSMQNVNSQIISNLLR